MYDNLGNLVSELLRSFGLTQEFIQPQDCFEAINDGSLFKRGLAAQQSSEGRGLSVVPLTLSTRESTLPANVTAFLWLEAKVSNAPYETFQFVHWVPKPVLEEARTRGDMRCSTHRDGKTGLLRLTLSYDPSSVLHRVWHAEDFALATGDEDPIPILKKFAPMIKFDAQLYLCSRVVMRNGLLPQEQQLSAAAIAGINAIAAYARGELEREDGWNDMYEYHIRAGKEVRGRPRRRILASGFIPVRRTY